MKKHVEEVNQEQNDVLDRLLANMGDAELNASTYTSETRVGVGAESVIKGTGEKNNGDFYNRR